MVVHLVDQYGRLQEECFEGRWFTVIDDTAQAAPTVWIRNHATARPTRRSACYFGSSPSSSGRSSRTACNRSAIERWPMAFGWSSHSARPSDFLSYPS